MKLEMSSARVSGLRRSSKYSSTVASENPVHAFVSPCCLIGRGLDHSSSGGANAIEGRYSQSRRSTESGRTLRLRTVRLRDAATGVNTARPGGNSLPFNDVFARLRLLPARGAANVA